MQNVSTLNSKVIQITVYFAKFMNLHKISYLDQHQETYQVLHISLLHWTCLQYLSERHQIFYNMN